ncbi:MAG: YihY/virulence factor BrkB family protein [Microthrixaceae bacterium]
MGATSGEAASGESEVEIEGDGEREREPERQVADDREGRSPSGSALTGRIERVVDRVDGFQRRVPTVAVPFGIIKKFGEDRGGQLAMLIAYKGFFSIFPLLLAFVSILGIVLRNNESLRESIVDSTISSIPVLATDISAGTENLSASWVVLAVSVAVSVWAGLGLLAMLGNALDTIWEVAVFDRPSWILRQLRCISGAVLVALCAVLSGAGRWILSAGWPSATRVVAGVVFPLVAGAAAYLGLHQALCVRKVPFKSHIPGMVATALAWWGMLSLGGFYFDRVVSQSSDTYGVFAVVLGLLSWSYLLATLYLYSVTLAAVLADRRWPRSLSGRNLTDQDREAVEAMVQRGLRVRGTEFDLQVPRNPEK